MSDFWRRLRQRKLVQWAIAYVAFAFALIQVVDVVADSYDWPHLVMHFVFGILALGLVVMLVLAWYHGERGAQHVSGPELLLIALALAIGGGLLWHFGHAPATSGVAHAAATTRGAPPATATMAGAMAGRTAAASIPRDSASTSTVPLAAAEPIPAKSVAVLPFVNESGNKDQQYFSDGLSQDLITALSQFAGLKVISRNSAFQFRNSKEPSVAIGKALGVANLLEGTVERAGDEVRVTASLVKAADGSIAWQHRYDKPYKDLFALQDAITKAVADALKARLLMAPGAVVQSDQPPSRNLAAYAAYLQGQASVAVGTLPGQRAAADDFRKAIRLDPRYALAYAALARAWVWIFRQGHTPADEQQYIAHARKAIQTALTLDPELAAAHASHGYLLYSMNFDWYGAEAEYRRALQLAPNDAQARAELAFVLASLGQNHNAIVLLRTALQVDPRASFEWRWLGDILASVGQLDAAQQAVRKGMTISPHAAWTYEHLAVYAVLRGNARQAMKYAREEPSSVWRRVGIALSAQIGSSRKAADAALQDLIAHDAATGAYQIAEVYALRHDPNAMFHWLGRAWAQTDAGIESLLSDPFILRYRTDPRFAAFCKKAGLPTTTDAVALK